MVHGGPSGGRRQPRHSQRRYRSQDTIGHKEAQVTFEVLVTVKDSKGCYHRNRLVSLAYAVNE